MMKTKKMKSYAVLTAVAAVAAALFCAVVLFAVGKPSSAEVFESVGDRFELTETEYGRDEAFVYTASVEFADGQAAGLVFGAKDGEHYYVFNVDRKQNRVKLLYFQNADGSMTATELLTDRYVGNDKMTDSEKALVDPKVANIGKVSLKVVVTPEADGVHAEFFADNIKRFGVDRDILLDELEKLPDGVTYGGGALGYNGFESKVTFGDVYIGASDYSYYSELYRQQYHFSQYAHWNNDPNGLVYYDGWYHIYYQHHPYSNYWGDMYWGHARSRDLVHWQHLPICLFPDRDFNGSDGYMWSGSAFVYHKGDSAKIDELGWFGDADSGIIAYCTRDGGGQNQLIMTSSDGGMTWDKRKLIPQSTATGTSSPMSCRDPKVFPVQTGADGKTTVWGMALTGMEANKVWFLKSADLVDWSYAGEFSAHRPECPDVVTLTADDGTTHTVMTFTGRRYLVGEIVYDNDNIVFEDLGGNDVNDLDEIPFQTMDFGPDSYATQSYAIDADSDSEYKGKTVSVNWFSGVPDAPESINSGLLADARKVWNGGGMTIPVIWGLKKSGGGYVLTQTPIVKDGSGFADIKTEICAVTGKTIDENSENPLSEIDGHCFEIDAEIVNPDGAAVSFKINMRGDEYVEIGWNKEDGYFVDRTHAGDAGLSMGNYRVKYSAGGKDATRQTFYILSDNGGVEVFCDDFSKPFYVLTFSSPYATRALFSADGSVTVDLTVNAIASVWRDAAADETILYLDADSVELDGTLMTEKEIMAYSTAGGDIEWRITSGENTIAVEKTDIGAKIKALAAGKATIAVSCGDVVKNIDVTVHGGVADSDLQFAPSGIVSGNWYLSSDGILGVQSSGDGFIMSTAEGGDFTYSATFKLSGAAAAVVFRAAADMSDYIIANYDHNGRVVKLWSPRGELGRSEVDGIDPESITLRVRAYGKVITVSINGREVINATLGDDEPTSGFFGLNACAARVAFSTVALLKESYDYNGSGALAVGGDTAQTIIAVYDVTGGNAKINSAYYTVSGRTITISEEYFAALGATGARKFKVAGKTSSFEFTVNVSALPAVKLPSDMTVENGCNAIIHIGGADVGELTLNGAALEAGDYGIKNGVLTVFAGKLHVGENTLAIGDDVVIITVLAANETAVAGSGEPSDNTVAIAVCSTLGALLLIGAAVLVTLLLLRKKKLAGAGEQKASNASDGDISAAASANTQADENGGETETQASGNIGETSENNITEADNGGDD